MGGLACGYRGIMDAANTHVRRGSGYFRFQAMSSQLFCVAFKWLCEELVLSLFYIYIYILLYIYIIKPRQCSLKEPHVFLL